MEYRITIEPQGTRVKAREGEDLLSLLSEAGIEIESVCGGVGSCGKCRIRVLKGKTNHPTPEEKDHLSKEQLDAGERLACRVYPRSDLAIEVPLFSLSVGQRLQLESRLEPGDFDPAVRCHEIEVEIPTSPGDTGSDLQRVLQALERSAPEEEVAGADFGGLRRLPGLLREERGTVRAVTRRGELLGLIPKTRNPLGLAVDLGSTKIALFLCDLAGGNVLASHGFLNPQVRYGEDIVTRIKYALQADASPLGRLVTEAINENLEHMLKGTGRSRDDIFEMVLAGNTAMHHLFNWAAPSGVAWTLWTCWQLPCFLPFPRRSSARWGMPPGQEHAQCSYPVILKGG